MPLYLIQATYSSESWKTQIQKQGNAADRIRPVVETLGGRLLGLYYAFGEHDVVGLMELPSNEAASAFSLAIRAGGAVSHLKTTPLMSIEEGQRAMKSASEGRGKYQAPVE